MHRNSMSSQAHDLEIAGASSATPEYALVLVKSSVQVL